MAILNRYSTGKTSQVQGGGARKVKPLAVPDPNDGVHNPINNPVIDPRAEAIKNLRRNNPNPGAPQPNLGPAPTQSHVETPEEHAANKAAAKEKAKGVQTQAVHDSTAKYIDENAITDLAALRAQQKTEREAAKVELEAQRGRAMQDVDSRSGLGGFGLSGASSALRSDTDAASTRSSVAALADLRARQRSEQGETLTRQIAINDAEDADNVDYDHINGIAGDPTETQDTADGRKQRQEYLARHPFVGDDYGFGDKDTDAGTVEEPFTVTPADFKDMTDNNGFTMTKVGRKVQGLEMYTDGEGHFFVIADDPGT